MTRLDGLLDAECSAFVRAAMQPFLRPDPPDTHEEDRRSYRTRCADALVQIARQAIAAGDPPRCNGLSLCWSCHTALHDGSWTACLQDDNTVTFTSPDGQVVTRAPP